jgi:ATP-dependent exoDNAse (exonuclease V) beta subunit
MTTPSELVDNDARATIATDLRSRLAVDAGAGSGKTTWLVKRIVSLVSEQGLPMSSIAAITFTEAAAAELRTRIRRTLTERAAEDEALLVAAREVDEAAICTIHAFALRLLSEHWLEAGLPPNVEVLDSAGQYLDHKSRWRSFTDDLLADPTATTTLVRAFAAGLRLSQLSEIGHTMVDHYDRLTPAVLSSLHDERLATADPTVSVAETLRLLRVALALMPRCVDDSDALCVQLGTSASDAVRRLEPLLGSADEATVISVLGDVGRLSFGVVGRKENWTVPVADVREACKDAETARTEMLNAVRESVVADLAWRIANWAVQSAAGRREEGRFTFHDLLVEACHMLRSDTTIRERARDRYRCLLIDEFQDTDPLQAELAHLLGAPSDAAGEAARLFVVGDPEQSIYRFRRADAAQFEATVARMDDRLTLSSNFRSVPGILDFVDQVFSQLLPMQAGPGAVEHRSLSATRPMPRDDALGPAVALFGGPDSEGRARDVRLQSTNDVATMTRSIIEEGWSVAIEGGAWRPALFGDIAVLLPTRTSLPMLERAFDDADIPYRLEGATLVWGSQDVRDVLAIARAVHEPANAVSVVAALRTPALACGDDDLVRYRTAGGSWDPRAPVIADTARDDPVTRAMGALSAMHEQRMWMDVSSLISAVLTDFRFFELALVHRRPRDHWHRLRWLLDQARAFDETKGGTIGDFLEWVDLSEEAERWTSSLGPPESDDDAVRVMTVHGAKGLEFPIVILTGLDSPPSNISASVLFDADGIPRFRFSAQFQSPAYPDLATADKGLDRAERFRLLYVALTRARDHLVVDLSHKQKSPWAMSAILHPICEGIVEGVARISPAPRPKIPGRQDDPQAPETDWWSQQAQWVRTRTQLLSSSARQPAWSVTALSAAAATDRGRPSEQPAESGTGRHHQRSGRGPEDQQRIGRAVHDALAKIDLPEDGVMTDGAHFLAMTAARAQRLDGDLAQDVVDLVRSALSSDLLRTIARHRHFKELPLAAPLPEGTPENPVVIEGFADLVGESDEGLIVVDFKTSTGRSGSSQYLWQVATYAFALQQTTGRRVARVVVSYLGVDGTEEESLEGEELEKAIGEVLRAANSPAGSADVADAGQLVFFARP